MKTAYLLASALCVLAGTAASAQGIHVTVDGTTVDFPDVQPQMISSRVMVPLRGVFEEFGANVHWDLSTQSVHIIDHDRKITMQIGSRTAIVNGNRVALDVPATMVGGRTMVPLRFISENARREVYWNASIRTVEIDSIALNARKSLSRLGYTKTRLALTSRTNFSV